MSVAITGNPPIIRSINEPVLKTEQSSFHFFEGEVNDSNKVDSYRIALLGEDSRDLISRFLRPEGGFEPPLPETKIVTFKERKLKVTLDICYPDRFRDISYSVFRGYDAVLLVCDSTNIPSLKQLEQHIDRISCNINIKNISLVATKCASSSRIITHEELKEFALKHRFDLFETDFTHSNKHVHEAFTTTIQAIMDSREPKKVQTSANNSSQIKATTLAVGIIAVLAIAVLFFNLTSNLTRIAFLVAGVSIAKLSYNLKN